VTDAVPAWIEKGDGARAVVLLHGVGGGKELWTPQLDHLAARGYRAIAWDAPGYGASPLPPRFDWPELSQALLVLLDRLKLAKVALVGHSMGGMVAQDFAARHPARLAALVLSGTSPAFGNPDGEFQRKFLATRLGPLDAGGTMAALAPEIVREVIGDAPDGQGVALATEVMARVPDATYRLAIAALTTFDRRAALSEIRVPTLVLAGERDRNAPPAMMERMAARIPGARYVCLAQAGHLANVEQPAAFDAALDAFLDALEPAAWTST
jgi:pimeloyl-ACP methyl ester carboxylesterase